MEIGQCPGCGRPYSAGEVTGLGILRPRPESRGGPLVEFDCPGCRRSFRLIPHGLGRFARPGTPPPPPVPEDQRVPPWIQNGEPGTRTAARGESRTDGANRDAAGRAEPARAAKAARAEPARHEAVPPKPVPTPDPGEPVTLAEAIRILGISPTAERGEIDRAFRERSVQCHPDKVAHLDTEIQAFAERKFRRLLEAYEMLTR